MTCLSISELCAADAAAIFEEHLAACGRCRALAARCQAQDAELGEGTPPPTRSAGSLEPGAVWTIWAPEVDQYLVAAVLEATDEEALILPLLPWVSWASEADIELESEVLGYAAIAPLWAGDHVLAEQAVEAVDVLSESCFAILSRAYDAFFSGEPIDAATGVPILSDGDPRIEAQAAVADELRPWYLPWSSLQSAEELGPVMEQRRDELGVELDSLSEEVGVDSKAWRAFEAGESDPYATVPVSALARAVRRLRLVTSRRLISLAHASVLANNEGQSSTQPALARRRRGSKRKRSRDPDVVRAAADEYANSLAEELGL